MAEASRKNTLGSAPLGGAGGGPLCSLRKSAAFLIDRRLHPERCSPASAKKSSSPPAPFMGGIRPNPQALFGGNPPSRLAVVVVVEVVAALAAVATRRK